MANTFNLGNGRNVFTNISVTPPLVDGDIVDGQNGDDVIDVTGNDLTLSGSNGDDQIIATGNDNTISGGRGRDELTATGRRNFLDGGQGEDVLSSNSSTSNFFDYGHGNTLAGGKGKDFYQITNQSDLIVNNSGDDLIGEGDQVEGLFDVITDYEMGEIIDINADTRFNGPISLDGFGGGHLHLLLEDGAYAILTGKSNNNGTFDIGAGPDSLIAWDNKGGINDPYFQGSLAVLGTAPENLNIM